MKHLITFDQAQSDSTIKDFCAQFATPDNIRLFTEGKCYWFAVILQHRFGGEIYYDDIEGHFVWYSDKTKKYYDIRGEYIPNYTPLPTWEEYDVDESGNLSGNKRQIIKNCILLKR